MSVRLEKRLRCLVTIYKFLNPARCSSHFLSFCKYASGKNRIGPHYISHGETSCVFIDRRFGEKDIELNRGDSAHFIIK